MYDAKSEPNEFVADSRSEAVAKASRFFGVDEAELTVRDPEPGEIFGLGSRVVVVAVPKAAAGRPRPSGGGDRDRDRDRGDRGRGRDRGDRGGRDRGGRGRDRDRGGRGGQETRSRRPEPEDRDRAREGAERRERSEPQPSTGSRSGEVGDIGEYVLGIVERMKLGSFSLSETEEDEFLVIQLEGAAADTLAEGDGRAVGAIQLLANQAAISASESAKRIVVDCGGESGEREDFLQRTASRAAKRAIDTGRSVALDPMNGRDRRQLHIAIRETDGVATMSIGTGRYRQVVIVPEGAPEYEEAIEASRAAEERDPA